MNRSKENDANVELETAVAEGGKKDCDNDEVDAHKNPCLLCALAAKFFYKSVIGGV